MKNDRYKKARGSWSRMLEINCAKCGQHVCYYQKDGAGMLKRMYIDRIKGRHSPRKDLVCNSCNDILGTQIIYRRENRPAYRLYVGAITKKIVKAKSV